MTTDMTVLQNTLPTEVQADVDARIMADIKRLGAVGGKDAIRITQDKKFEMPNGDILDEIEGVIVDFVYRNEYYPEAYNRKQIKPPTCFAIADAEKGMRPSPNSPALQDEGKGCDKCQWNQWGSSPTSGGKACKNTVYMALLPPNATDEDPIWTLKTSPTAIKHFNGYVAKLGHSMRKSKDTVVTKIFFDPGSAFASVRFEATGLNEAIPAVQRRAGEARARLLQEPDLSGAEEA
jgi:hypothetical protein